jgi:hypothetical protein
VRWLPSRVRALLSDLARASPTRPSDNSCLRDAGHVPPDVYTTPHFDMHFYLVSQEALMNISAGPCGQLSREDFTAANQPIPVSCFPGGGYVNMAAGVPMVSDAVCTLP